MSKPNHWKIFIQKIVIVKYEFQKDYSGNSTEMEKTGLFLQEIVRLNYGKFSGNKDKTVGSDA